MLINLPEWDVSIENETNNRVINSADSWWNGGKLTPWSQSRNCRANRNQNSFNKFLHVMACSSVVCNDMIYLKTTLLKSEDLFPQLKAKTLFQLSREHKRNITTTRISEQFIKAKRIMSILLIGIIYNYRKYVFNNYKYLQ